MQRHSHVELIENFLRTIRAELPSDIYAGVYWEAGVLNVGVTRDASTLARVLQERAPPGVRVKTYAARHSLSKLRELTELAWSEAEHLSAPVTSVGIDEQQNCVVVGLERLDLPAIQLLRERLRAEPIRFVEERIAPAGR